jgi:hypothetical protein
VPLTARRRTSKERHAGASSAGDPPEDLQQRTRAEITELASEFHTRLSRKSARSIGAIYARYSTRFQQSIGEANKPADLASCLGQIG